MDATCPEIEVLETAGRPEAKIGALSLAHQPINCPRPRIIGQWEPLPHFRSSKSIIEPVEIHAPDNCPTNALW